MIIDDRPVLHVDPAMAELRRLVEAARDTLAEVTFEYTELRHAVAATQARLFRHLHAQSLQRDLLRMRLRMRRKYLAALVAEGATAAERVRREQIRNERTVNEYEQTARILDARKPLSDEEARELKLLWRKLVRLYHPDRLGDDPARQAIHARLTTEINRARDAGDLATLKAIAADPEGFVASRGWGSSTSPARSDANGLRQLHDGLLKQTAEVRAALERFRATDECILHVFLLEHPEDFDSIVTEYREDLEKAIASLHEELAIVEGSISKIVGA